MNNLYFTWDFYLFSTGNWKKKKNIILCDVFWRACLIALHFYLDTTPIQGKQERITTKEQTYAQHIIENRPVAE